MKRSLSCDMVFIVGPSAVGKSAVALELAAGADGEIVSCDALQVYREAPVASDRPSMEALAAVPHHLVGCVSAEENFNAGRYRSLASAAIGDIMRRGRLPVVCGGSGMYMAVLLDGIFEEPRPVDLSLRRSLEDECAALGCAVLFERLRRADPAAAARIDPQDRQRIVRALEVVIGQGRPISVLQKERAGLWGQYRIRIFFLDRPRSELYARAEARVDQMLARGLVEEVRALRGLALAPSAARMIGLPEISGFLAGAYDLARARELMQRNTRRYIKRQLTWFRRDQRLERLEIPAGQTSAVTAGRILEMLGA